MLIQSPIAKAIIATLVSAAGAITVALGTSPEQTFSGIDATHWLLAALFVLGSGGIVWLTKNTAAAPIIKTVVAFLSAGLSSLVFALNDNHINQAEWLTAFTTAVIATGLVYEIKNKGAADVAPS